MNLEPVTASNFFAVRDNERRPMPATASTRFQLRVSDVLDEKGWTQRRLVKKLKEKDPEAGEEGWLSTKLRGSRGLKLNEAEQIAEALNVPLAELVRRPDDRIYELDNTEARIVEAFRLLTREEQDALMVLATLRQRPGVGKHLAKLRTDLTKGAAHGSGSATRGDQFATDLERLIARTAQATVDIALARQQAPSARPAQPDVSVRRGDVREPPPAKAGS